MKRSLWVQQCGYSWQKKRWNSWDLVSLKIEGGGCA